jgi:predicted amidohydrolase
MNITAAVLQLKPQGSVSDNLQHAESLLQEAAKGGRAASGAAGKFCLLRAF